ncbi:MAG: DUF2802 domain-containing protein [Gammaproteobacteria bacterium]|nr:DUF2802 domain-containing protein [Gammaproteobacteria bacterium]MDP2140864.1 DUF2802 domain-containing protein [Gammaproteobacteria bacterium]MDP2349393.1 DUF2802 domain-containing protein [Gammaproteobacteria bacterium]
MSPVVIYSLFVVLLLAAGLFAQMLHTLRRMQQVQTRMETDMLVLRNELTAVGRGTVGLGKRVQQMHQRLQTVQHRQEDMEHKDVGNIAISHANKLVQMGVATDELISACGLSQAEASLVSLMHGNTRKTKTVSNSRQSNRNRTAA